MWCRSDGCGLLARLLAASLLLAAVLPSFRHRARRLEWELHAIEEPPHGPCGGGRHLQKELTLKPARRAVARFELEAQDQDGGMLRLRVEGEPVDALNAAVGAHRRHRHDAGGLREALLPVARGLADRVETWLSREAEARRDVSVGARLEGGKAEWTFTPWRCVRGRWRKGRQWRAVAEDARDEPVALLSHPYPVAVSAEVLLSQLTLFVPEVDVTESRRLPQRAPLLHG